LVEVSALTFVKTAISPTDVSCTPSSSWIAALISSALSSGNACAKRSDCGGESLVPEHSDCGGKSSVPEHSGFGGRSSVPRHVDGGVIESTSCMFVEEGEAWGIEAAAKWSLSEGEIDTVQRFMKWVSAVAFGEGVGNVGWATGVGSVAWATIAGPGGVAEVAVLFSAAPESMTPWMIRAPLGILDGVAMNAGAGSCWEDAVGSSSSSHGLASTSVAIWSDHIHSRVVQ
jgi:hypothetical protein